MREFIYFSGRAVTTGNFTDLMKAGRMDIVAHIVIHSFFVSNARRNNVKLNLFFYGPPNPVQHLEIYSEMENKESSISKKDVIGLIKRMLFKGNNKKKVEALPCCFIEKKGLIKYLEELKDREVYILDARGEDIQNIKIGENPVFIMGDHEGIPAAEKRRITKSAKKVSLGKITYFASQSMAILQNELDRREIF